MSASRSGAARSVFGASRWVAWNPPPDTSWLSPGGSGQPSGPKNPSGAARPRGGAPKPSAPAK